MSRYYIGTSGFSYQDWVGTFYPDSLRKEDFLPYYAEHFPFVELNFTYYRLPHASAIEKLENKTPEGFLFSVKAHKSITHERDEGWEREADAFLEGISPLIERGSLAGVLLQFPYSFHYTQQNRRYLASLCDRIAGCKAVPLLVEFRNAEWSRESVQGELSDRNIGTVVTDTPNLKNLPETEAKVSAKTAYFRLHGRNARTWWTGDNSTRYDYLYNGEELTELLPVIDKLMGGSTRLFIAFNNHHKGQAVENARMLKQFIEEEIR